MQGWVFRPAGICGFWTVAHCAFNKVLTGHHGELDAPDASRDQRAFCEIADAHGHVDALLHQVDEPVIGPEVDLDARVCGEERMHVWAQHTRAKPDRTGQSQPAGQLLLAWAQLAFGLRHFRDQTPRGFEIALAVVGQG